MFLTMTDTITFNVSSPESLCSLCPVVVVLVAGCLPIYCVLLVASPRKDILLFCGC